MFRKMDFHVHTPASSCYLDHIDNRRGPTRPEDILRGAATAGLDAMVVVDHNTAAGIDPLRQAIRDREIVIFPGVEITAKGGHLLGVFNPGTPIAVLQSLVLKLGFTPQQMGQGFEEAPFWMDEVFQFIAEAGGIALAAHVDRRPRGFVVSEELKREEKRRIYNSPFLSGLEITIPFDKELWTKGLMPGYPQGKGCVQGSDAHAPEEMGRRPVYLDVPGLDLAGLRLALQEAEARIKFPGEIEVSPRR